MSRRETTYLWAGLSVGGLITIGVGFALNAPHVSVIGLLAVIAADVVFLATMKHE